MDSTNQNSKAPRMLCDVDQQQDMFFSHSTAASFSKRNTRPDNFGCMKRMAIREPAEGRRAKRTKSVVLKAPSENDPLTEHSSFLEEDFDLKSDAESSCCQGLDAIDTAANDEESINEFFYHGGARKKLKLLADMVGVDPTDPGFVLAKVVAVLKNLKSKSEY